MKNYLNYLKVLSRKSSSYRAKRPKDGLFSLPGEVTDTTWQQSNANGGDAVLLEHIGTVNSSKCDFQYRMRAHTLMHWELSVTSTFHSKWQKSRQPPSFLEELHLRAIREPSVQEWAIPPLSRTQQPRARADSLMDNLAAAGGVVSRGGGIITSDLQSAGQPPTNRRAAQVRGTSIVCLLLLLLIIEAAVRILGCLADEDYGSGRGRRRESEIRDDGPDQKWR